MNVISYHFEMKRIDGYPEPVAKIVFQLEPDEAKSKGYEFVEDYVGDVAGATADRVLLEEESVQPKNIDWNIQFDEASNTVTCTVNDFDQWYFSDQYLQEYNVSFYDKARQLSESVKKQDKEELLREVEKIVRKELQNKASEKIIKDIIRETMTNLYKTMWLRRATWLSGL